MGLIIGLVKRLLKLTIFFFIFAALIVLIPNLPPYTNFTSIPVEPTLEKVGPLATNEVLNNAQQTYKGKLLGPEAFQLVDGDLYTGLATGEIVKISPGGHVTFVTKIGQPCTGLSQEHICGRPLGFQIVGKNMYVADAYYGIWKVDLNNDKKQLLVSPRVEINGKLPKLFNSVAFDKKGNLYWTDSSSDVYLRDGAYTSMMDPAGRLYQYDSAKNESKVLLDNLWFANGVAVSRDDTFVIVAETMAYRVMKYYINGPKKGKSEVFIAGLPGTPDNVRVLPDGSGALIALYTAFDQDHVLLTRSMTETPVVRKFIARFMKLVETPFEFFNNIYPHFLFEDVVHNVGNFKTLSAFLPGLTGLVQVDWEGKVVASYYNTDRSVSSVSDAIVYNDRLYLGTAHGADFIASVPAPPLLKKAFTSIKESIGKPKIETKPEQPKVKPVEKPKVKPVEPKVEVKKEAPKVTKPATETPKTTQVPKATTQKPVDTKPVKPAQPTPKPVQKTTPQPKTEEKQSQQASKTEQKKTTPTQPELKTPTPQATEKPKVQQKEAVSTTAKPPVTTPKTAQKKEEPPKVSTLKSDSKSTKPEPKQAARGAKPIPEQIPIEEQIPSDTIKPSKDTLKVIKKGGPTEIPNPQL